MSDDEIVKEFLVESYENLDRLDRDLLELEKNPTASEILASIFRTIHTIKGTCGFLGFSHLEKVAHAGENLLTKLREGELTLNAEIATALLKLVDSTREMLLSIESKGNEGERDDSELIATLTRLLEAGAKVDAPKKLAESVQKRSAVPKSKQIKQEETRKEAAQAQQTKRETAGKAESEEEAGSGGAGEAAGAEPATATSAGRQPVVEQHPAGEVPGKKPATKTPEPAEAQSSAKQQQNVGDTTIRVDVSLLDQLMNLVGELVLARNQILQFTNTAKEAGLLATSQRLNLITTELQEGVMKTRMQPIGNVWSKFPRVVRDLAMGCGKQVRIEMEGKETELDKTIIEAIKDPLTHLVRNAIDHGIESPEARRLAGKNPEGGLSLRAFHEGGQVNIEISDDGAGLNLEKIRDKAVHKGLISSDQALRMSDREVANLIFMAGLSTAEKVTNVSGRGVGMDVVKTNIEKIGGTVDVQSKLGQGTTIRVKIPLTLAIIPALMVTSGGDRYAIPQVSLLELVRIEGEHARKGIELIHGAPVYRLRGRLLPLVYLNRELKVGSGGCEGKAGPSTNELSDFATARAKHGEWVDRLKRVVDGKLQITADQAGSPRDCALGKWLYSVALKEYGDMADMHTLEATHRRFHAEVREVVDLHRKNGDTQAALAQVTELSKKIFELLTRVERTVAESQNVNIVVLQAEDRQFGLVVDGISDTEEIVVKPLSKHIKATNAYAGATILGDGRVALILDVLGLAQHANVVTEVHDQAIAEKEAEMAKATGGGHGARTVLLFQNGDRERMAVELSQVARLEEFSRDALEIVAGRDVVQYRGQIMPLVRVAQLLGGSVGQEAADSPSRLQVVVYSDQERTVGLVIDRILDIVEESFEIQPNAQRNGVLGCAVIQKRTTELLDVPTLVASDTQFQVASQGA